MSHYAFIRACVEPWPVQVLCRLLAISSAGYYQWRKRVPPPAAVWQPAAQAAFARHAHRTRAPCLGTSQGATPALIVHADRGSQYTSAACRARIDQAGAVPSFSRPGNPYDNAQAEAGWSTLKTELLPGNAPFASLEEARLAIVWYLDTYFNLDRRHSAFGYHSPH